MVAKTDNANTVAKLDLRRYFLRKYHADAPISVLDCCQGSGVLWGQLRKEFPAATVWGVDVKARNGRLTVDSSRVICQAGWTQNVVDIDTYGSPWKHWLGMLPNVTQPTTVFLTIGTKNGMPRKAGETELDSLGIGGLDLPAAITMKLTEIAVRYELARTWDHGITLVEAVEASRGAAARYIGVRIEPTKMAAPQLSPAKRPKHTHANKEREHV